MRGYAWGMGWVLMLVLSSCETLSQREANSGWADVMLYATGKGQIEGAAEGFRSPSDRMRAIREVKRDTYRKLASQIVKLEVLPGRTVLGLMEKDPQVKVRVFRFVRGARLSQMINTPEGIEGTAQLYLGEDFKATLGVAKKKPLPSAMPREGDRGDFSN